MLERPAYDGCSILGIVWCLLDGIVPLQMTFWFTVMLLIVGIGDETGK